MRNLYKYTGTVSSFSYRRNSPNALPSCDLILFDSTDDSKAPVRIEATGGLADYINHIEMTDAEERYLNADWFYDNNLFLYRIEIPSNDPSCPAKIIAQLDPIAPDVSIFGHSEYIETRHPEPMPQEDRCKWFAFHLEVIEQTKWK